MPARLALWRWPPNMRTRWDGCCGARTPLPSATATTCRRTAKNRSPMPNSSPAIAGRDGSRRIPRRSWGSSAATTTRAASAPAGARRTRATSAGSSHRVAAARDAAAFGRANGPLDPLPIRPYPANTIQKAPLEQSGGAFAFLPAGLPLSHCLAARGGAAGLLFFLALKIWKIDGTNWSVPASHRAWSHDVRRSPLKPVVALRCR